MEYSTKHIAYLRRTELDAAQEAGRIPARGDVFLPDPASLQLLAIRSIGRFWDENAGGGARQGQAGLPTGSREREQSGTGRRSAARATFEYRTFDVLGACWGSKIPIVYLLFGTPTGVRLAMGTVSTPGLEPPLSDGGPAARVLRDCMLSQYPGACIEELSDEQRDEWLQGLDDYRHCGVITGLPINKRTEEVEDPTQIDRLIRTMQGTDWGLMVVARPLEPEAAMTHFNEAVMDMRRVQNAEPRPTPMAGEYLQLLDAYKNLFATASSGGLWSTMIYGLAKRQSGFLRLRAGISLCFGAGDSVIDPVRVTPLEGLDEVAPRFGQIMTAGAPSPMSFRRPLRFQTSMHSLYLGTFVHLPRLEMPGFIVRDQARFDVAPHLPAEAGSISLGEILDRGRPLGDHYRASRRALNKHALVVGVTGSGKTNTIFHMLRAARRRGVPFLALEPAKTEYRALLDDEELGAELQVFSIGDESVAPFRMNPFAVEPGASIATHIDLLKATFNASFAMWPPLPQVLERCIHAIYQDRGWDIVRNRNRRLREGEWESGAAHVELAFPTLTELYRKIEEVVTGLGYEERVTSDIRAALSTRIHSLRIGGKGAMLDTQRSVGLEHVLERPTIFELEQVGDDEEKAFLMGLLLMRIYERHRARGVAEGRGLSHLIVIEEAHRLLARVPEQQASAEAANPRGKAVEAFVNMLSEVRAYGQGFVVAEQIPTKLAVDVIKNTNLKVVHRTVAGDDRELLAQTMNMPQRQSGMLATLTCGEAAVFSEGDDRPILVQVPYAKLAPSQEMATRRGSDRVVAARMNAFRTSGPAASAFVPFAEFAGASEWPGELVEFGQQMIERAPVRELFMAVVLAALEHPPALSSALQRLRRYVFAHAPRYAAGEPGVECVAAHGTEWYVTNFGRRLDWAYEHVPELSRHLARLVRNTRDASDSGSALALRAAEFRTAYMQACEHATDWTLPVADVGPERSAIFRYHTESLLVDESLTELFDIGMAEAADAKRWTDLRAVDQAVARLGGFDLESSSQRGLALAYALQQILYKPGLLEIARHMATEKVLEALSDHYAPASAPAPADDPAFASADETFVAVHDVHRAGEPSE